MRRGYSQEIRAEAITKRYEGKTWKEVQAAISRKFGLKPSIRQMQEWLEDYQGTTGNPTVAEYLAKTMKEVADVARPLAQARMMLDVMPLWSQLKEQHKISDPDAGWIALLYFLEAQIGRQSFDRILNKYGEIRDNIKGSYNK